MQTLSFWNSIEECGLPSLVYTHQYGSDSELVLLSDGHPEGGAALGYLVQYGSTDDPKIDWLVKDKHYPIQTFTHWAYIPAVPNKEGK